MRFAFLLFFATSALLALISTPAYEEAGMQVFENPSDPANSAVYFALILAFTAFILLAAKFKKILAAVMYFLTFLSVFYVLIPFFGALSLIAAVAIVLMLLKKPHWIVTDVSAILLAAGISAIFGVSLEPLPAMLLLTALAVYDLVAVYRTRHMIRLAESVSEFSVPVLFVVPSKDKKAYMGVGDVVIPCILAASAQRFSSTPEVFGFKVSALATVFCSLLALAALLILIEKRGGAHPGLPFVNSGAIIGFLLAEHAF
ncbi:MAG: presenilin family intramembrane aspartyl protease PSH [Archaeoglobaceae archaeon]